jgi:hypothetical protein
LNRGAELRQFFGSPFHRELALPTGNKNPQDLLPMWKRAHPMWRHRSWQALAADRYCAAMAAAFKRGARSGWRAVSLFLFVLV